MGFGALKDAGLVEIDAEKGIVRKISKEKIALNTGKGYPVFQLFRYFY